MRHHLRLRRFLNKLGHHAGAYVVAMVADSSSCTDEGCSHRWCTDVVLDIADCSRVVHLDFPLDSAAERRNSLHKIDVLIDVLTRFRDALQAEASQIERRAKTKGAARS